VSVPEGTVQNYIVRMPDRAEMARVLRMMTATEPGAHTMALGAGRKRPHRSKTRPDLLVGALDEGEIRALERDGAEVYEDFALAPMAASAREYWRGPVDQASAAAGRSLTDVLEHIRVVDAWRVTRGAGVTIAVVDTGICGEIAEFPLARRSPIDLPTAFAGDHWNDTQGHGSMCAAIAAAGTTEGGRYDGVAPGATLLAARTTLMATDLFDIYDELVDLKRSGAIGPLVISNSYGLYTCGPTGVPPDHPYLEIVLAAIDEGVPVVFAAGNNHFDVACNHDPSACAPSTIWAINSHDRVISVGTVNRDNSNRDTATPHVNSSRGPGEWAVDLPKPDCVAPTYGEVVWGCGYRIMDWWGTSGACPQVAGLAALLLAANPLLSPASIADMIRGTCRDIGAPATCVGHGLIDCAAAVEMATAVA